MTLRNTNKELDMGKLSLENRASLMLATDQKDDLKEKFMKVRKIQ
jgi:hypothetical protein